MLKLVSRSPGLRVAAFTLGLAILAGPGAAQAAMGPDAAACRGNRPAVLVTVDGFKQRTGNVRVNVYGSDPRRFLERGQYVRQIQLPVTQSGAMPICVALPEAGRYAVAVRHDLDGDGRSGWSDGGGFSRNPRISLTNLRPSFENVAFNVGPSGANVNVTLLYRYGLSIRPAG